MTGTGAMPGLGRRLTRLGVAVAATAIFWLAVLPAVSRLPRVRDHIRRNQQRGINPAAMFYTEVGSVRGVQVRYRDGQPHVTETQIGDPP